MLVRMYHMEGQSGKPVEHEKQEKARRQGEASFEACHPVGETVPPGPGQNRRHHERRQRDHEKRGKGMKMEHLPEMSPKQLRRRPRQPAPGARKMRIPEHRAFPERHARQRAPDLPYPQHRTPHRAEPTSQKRPDHRLGHERPKRTARGRGGRGCRFDGGHD